MTCPGSSALERAFPAAKSEELARHLGACPDCRGEWERMETLAALVRDLPVETRSPDRVGAVRDAVLAAAASSAQAAPSRSSWTRVAIAVAASLVVLALFVRFWPGTQASTDAPPFRARVVASSSAKFVHQPLPDETVRLTDGTVSLDVEHLREGERLRVVTGDAEVEVRGTRFVVEARADRLHWVHVFSGRVEVRVKGMPPVELGPLDYWRPAPEVIALSPVVPSSTPEATPRGTSRTAAAPGVAPAPVDSPRSAIEAKYREAWDAYRAGQHEIAAGGFGDVLRAEPDGMLAADAAWWRSVALSRAGSKTEAKAALQGYLRAFPGTPREGEASAMLGWILFEERDLAGAQAAFEHAVRAGPEAASTLGSEGISAIESLRMQKSHEKRRND